MGVIFLPKTCVIFLIALVLELSKQHTITQKEVKKMNVYAEMFANGKSGKEVVMSYLLENGYAFESYNGLMYDSYNCQIKDVFVEKEKLNMAEVDFSKVEFNEKEVVIYSFGEVYKEVVFAAEGVDGYELSVDNKKFMFYVNMSKAEVLSEVLGI